MKKFFLFILVAVIVLALLTACGGSSDTEEVDDSESSTTQAITVVMNDIFYGENADNATNPPVWTVKSGNIVTVNSENIGVLEHNWAIVEAGVTLPATVADPAEIENDLLYDVGLIAGGETWTSSFTAPDPGEYTIVCTVAGHYPAMQGKLVVEE